MSMLKVVLLVILLASEFSKARATCTVVILDASGIVMGSDGLEKHRNGTDAIVCKIASGGRWAFTMNGLVRNDSSGFNLVEVARQSFRMKIHLEDQIVNFEQSAATAIEKEIDRERSGDAVGFSIRDGDTIARLIFAAIEDGSPMLIVCEFRLEGPHVVVLPSRRIRPKPGRRVLVFCGAAPSLKKQLPQFSKLDAPAIVARIIQFMIDSQRDDRDAGYPIAAVRIGAEGISWVEKGPCPAEPEIAATRR